MRNPVVALGCCLFVALTTTGALARDIAVRPGESLEAVLEGAKAGDRLVLHGGVYPLTKPLVLESRHSGIALIAAPGETPVLSGAASVTGWRCADAVRGLWQAQVKGMDVRQLYVQGRKGRRAVSPDACTVIWASDGLALKTSGSAVPKDGGLELLVRTRPWTQDRLPVTVFRDGRFCFPDALWTKYVKSMKHPKHPMTARMANAKAFLREAGDWCQDRTDGTLWLLAGPNLDVTKIQVDCPATESLVVVRGTAERPVENIVFSGLTFTMAGWAPKDGMVYSAQANQGLDLAAALDISHARDVRVARCAFHDLGGMGVSLGTGCRDGVVTRSTFHDIAAGAIQIGAVDAAVGDSPQAPCGNTVADCLIHDVASDYPASCAVFVGYAAGTSIAHNEIHSVPYTGISLGWGWTGPQVAAAVDNRIYGNHIHDHMRVLADGGGIYVNGRQRRGLIHGNWIHGQKHAYAQLYLDDGATDWTATDNVCAGGGPEAAWNLYKGEGNRVMFNFSDTGFIYKRNTGPCVVRDNTVVAPGHPWPAKAQAIMAAAGVRPEPAGQDFVPDPKREKAE